MQESDSTGDDRVDLKLLAELAAGSEDAFVELYRRRQPDVYRFAFAMARSRAFAQDVTQEVFLNGLLGCARHKVLDRLRLERRWTDAQRCWTEAMPPEAAECDHDERLFADQRVERLHAAVARLPVEYRETLVLCELEELSYAETAAVIGCPVGTVRSRLHRGRALLVVLLDETGGPAAAVDRTLRTSEVCS
jgi:RNA polymerase sigma-70 factor (ECF subfamily)